MRIGVLLSLLISLSSSASAAEAVEYLALGIGNHSCGKFVAEEKNSISPESGLNRQGKGYVSTVRMYQEWANGYLTRTNLQRALLRKSQIDVDSPGVVLWLRNWCNQHPTQDFAVALDALSDGHTD